LEVTFKGLRQKWREAGFDTQTGHSSIHASNSIRFSHEVLQAGEGHMRILTQGYQPAFSKIPEAYREENNRSALTDMEVVRDQVQKWKEGGYITELPTPALCTNPLSVVSKTSNETGLVKKRV
jgi:hypothetical protein